MSSNKYLAVITQNTDVVFIEAFLVDNRLGFSSPQYMNFPDGNFGIEAQVDNFKKNGFDVDLQKNKAGWVISAIPENSKVNHAEWMQTAAEFLKEQK